MDDLINYIRYFSFTIFGGIMGYFIRLFIEHRLAIDRIKENIKLTEFNKAASRFRSTIIYELSGFYPIEQGWDTKVFPRLYQSIPRINSAAAEFRHLVTRKTDFDTAIKEYNKYCREIKENDIFTLDFPSMAKPSDIKPKDRFKNIVEHLISFADEIK